MENIKTTWGNRFIIAAIIQGGIITAMTLIIVGIQITFTEVNIMQFLSLSFEGPAKWFFIGTIFYLILVVAVAVTAVFYNHLEINLNRKFFGASRILAWIHIIGMNVGGTGTSLLMIFAGLAASGVLSLFSKGEIGKENIAIMDTFIAPIASFIGILGTGVICGGIGFILAYKRKTT
ncbi:MAG: hypothetical protein ACE5J2_08170 [Nitrososphaerales archaeon]